MPGGCWICNPMCGKCQPATLKSGKCPQCSESAVFEREKIQSKEPLLCKRCGFDLSDLVRPQVVRCNYSGLLCAYPCGKSRSPRHDYGDLPCKRNTPPSPEWYEEHPDSVL